MAGTDSVEACGLPIAQPEEVLLLHEDLRLAGWEADGGYQDGGQQSFWMSLSRRVDFQDPATMPAQQAMLEAAPGDPISDYQVAFAQGVSVGGQRTWYMLVECHGSKLAPFGRAFTAAITHGHTLGEVGDETAVEPDLI